MTWGDCIPYKCGSVRGESGIVGPPGTGEQRNNIQSGGVGGSRTNTTTLATSVAFVLAAVVLF